MDDRLNLMDRADFDANVDSPPKELDAGLDSSIADSGVSEVGDSALDAVKIATPDIVDVIDSSVPIDSRPTSGQCVFGMPSMSFGCNWTCWWRPGGGGPVCSSSPVGPTRPCGAIFCGSRRTCTDDWAGICTCS